MTFCGADFRHLKGLPPVWMNEIPMHLHSLINDLNFAIGDETVKVAFHIVCAFYPCLA